MNENNEENSEKSDSGNENSGSNASGKSHSFPKCLTKLRAAKSRERGEEYMSYKGKVVPAKQVNLGLLCSEKCPLMCSDKLNSVERTAIFDYFYSLEVNCKNMFLFDSITIHSVKRSKVGVKKHKSASYKYKFVVDSADKFICKRAFCSVLRIGRKKVELIQNQLKSGVSTPHEDLRGKYKNRTSVFSPGFGEDVYLPEKMTHSKKRRKNNTFTVYDEEGTG